MLRNTLHILLIAALAFAGSACQDAPVAGGVQHLDLRLPDGSSATDALVARRAVVASWDIEGVETELAPWFLHEPFLKVPARGDRPGILVGDVETDPGVFPRVKLGWRGSVRALDFNVLELDLKKDHRSNVRVAWRLASDPVDEPLGRHAVDLTLDATSDQVSVAIALEGHADWRDEITELVFIPCTEGPQRFEISGIRFVQVGFAMGPDALALEESPRSSADGGMLSVGQETRRVWPSDWDVPLFAEADVFRGAQLSVDTAIPGVLANLDAEIHFAIDLRTKDTKWMTIAERELIPRETEAPTSWVPLLADLTRWEGERVRLRFRNYVVDGDADSALGLGGELRVARAYWGAPLVVPELPPDRRPNIVLVTIDTMRADRVGRRTPFLDRMRDEGQEFTNAWTACNATTPSHASILTGVHVADHGVVDNYSLLANGNRTLAEMLREEGYHTAGAVSVRHLQTGSSGLGQGMDQFCLAAPFAATNGGLTLEVVQGWLREWNEIGDRPFFLWVHFFDPHTPYGPPEAFLQEYIERYGLTVPPKEGNDAIPESHYTYKGQFLDGVSNLEYAHFLYDAGVSYSDLLLEELWKSIESYDLAEETMLFVTADHGESLGEHDHYFHHTDLFEGVMRVPLLTMIPGERGGVSTDDPVSTLDIVATLTERLQLDAHHPLRGTDLFSGRDSAREIFFAHSHLQQLGTCDDAYYFIATVEDYEQLGREHRIPAGTKQLFDRERDPELLRDISGEEDGVADQYDEKVRTWRSSALESTTVRRELTDEQLRELERLGYTDVQKD